MSLPMQKAKYLARAVASNGLGTSSKGNHQIAVTMEIADHPDFAGHEITWLGSFTEKTEDRTIESLQHMGWTGDDLTDFDNASAARIAELLPSTVEIVCEPDTYDGETNLKVRWVNKPGAGSFTFKEPLTGSALKSFAAQMRGKIRGAQQGGGQTRPTTPAQKSLGNGGGAMRHPNAPRDQDDIPFATSDMDRDASPIARCLR